MMQRPIFSCEVHIAVGASAEGTEAPREQHVMTEMALLMLLADIRKASCDRIRCMLCHQSDASLL